MNENHFKITVPDMTCQHCKMKIESALNDFPEIESISIDLNSKEIDVNAPLDKKILISRLEKEGYHPE